ncbi:uncharacterized protein LOC113161028 [Anabas testudineus]|uniref:uncharacterized protein LOC113161028 n=1 Tax=Anabas testudineus TaxID=64144 RepID=UPI000E45A937|nr:uncharacterized protein LOC113161028 [Anabas testudineus]XP_026214303.1 uncharacterized protein LOC113161028 [Anabas testudineus]
MDDTEENMTLKEMLEVIAELEYSQNQLKDLNAEMRQWLDVADDDMAALRSENAVLKTQVKTLEKTISAAQQIEAEPCGSHLSNDLDVQKCSGIKIHRLEEEATMMKEQNKKLNAELKSLHQEREQDKSNLSKFKVAIQTLEKGMGEADIWLQDKDDVIHQKNLKLKYLEETIEECSNFITELRLTNQELRKQLEDRQDEAAFFSMNDQIGQREGLPSPVLSFAEEIKLLASSTKVKTSTPQYKHLRHGETDGEELLKSPSLTTKRCAGTLKTAVHKVGIFILCIFLFAVLGFVTSGICATKYDLFSINTLWRSARLMLQPYCRVHYGALPPM